MEELRAGLWAWWAPHPNWSPEQGGPDGWGPEVWSYAWDDGDRLLLFDPLAPPDDLPARKRIVMLTCGWHGRSAPDLGAPIHAPGDSLPDGIEARPASFSGEAVLWIPVHGALVFGDSLVAGPRVNETWVEEGATVEEYKATLRPLADLPVELLLLTHGGPVVSGAREKLEAALAPA